MVFLIKRYSLFALFAVLATSCDRPNAPDCFQRAGEWTVETREVGANVELIEVRDVIDLVLHDHDAFYLEVEGPYNLLNDIETSVVDGKLTIRDHNTCNFVRKLGLRYKVHVYGEFRQLEHWGAGNVETDGVLERTSLFVENHSASGSHYVRIVCDTLSYKTHTGTVDVTLEGTVHQLYMFNQGYDFMDARGVQAEKAVAHSNSINRMDVRASDYLQINIRSDGDVHYWEVPASLNVIGNGSGSAVFED